MRQKNKIVYEKLLKPEKLCSGWWVERLCDCVASREINLFTCLSRSCFFFFAAQAFIRKPNCNGDRLHLQEYDLTLSIVLGSAF